MSGKLKSPRMITCVELSTKRERYNRRDRRKDKSGFGGMQNAQNKVIDGCSIFEM